MQREKIRNRICNFHRATGRLLSGLAICLSLEVAAAEAPETKVRVEVRAPQGCTSTDDVRTRILERLPKVRFDGDAEFVARASFTLLPSGNVVAELTLAKANATPASRRVVARSCTQAADAVALIVSVTLDPSSIREVPAAKTSADSGSVSGDDTRKGTAAEAANPRANSETPSSVPKGPENSERAPARPELRGSEPTVSSHTPARLRYGAQLVGGVLFGIAPGPMPALGASVVGALDREALWSPALVLSATHGFRGGFEERGGTARFALDSLSVDACTIRVQGGDVELRGCASGLVGQLSAEGSSTSNSAGAVHRPFATLGIASLLSVRLHPLVEVTARAAAGVNLVRDSFEFDPLLFHTVPGASYSLGLGLGLRSR